MPTRWASFRLNEATYERARQAAAADRRSLSNWLALTVERRLEEIASEQEQAQPVT